ncbi:hypothetical protein [Lentibacillus sp. CBA3610]|uniref:hypothetical protein n=1 Tax=Lentibacillus sp. CBA3610 TaxID=2518176 RepID=UPI001595C2EF|nr:hypothetical protein [Lentibacillus sp. CBA3610]QKY68684.1 hypothetical protein Len3610_02740 [Lentibacillus sp. CBA3610]
MIVLAALLVIVPYLVITKTQFFNNKYSNNKLLTQLGMAILMATITINTLFTSNVGMALKYTVVGVGIMSFIGIIIEILISKKQQTTS